MRRKGWIYPSSVVATGMVLFCAACTAPRTGIQASSRSEALALYSLGLLAEAQDDDAAAFAYWNRALKLDPDEALIYASAVPAALRLDLVDQAERLLSNWVRRHPECSRARLMLGRVAVSAGKTDLAESLFLDAIDRFPEQTEHRVALILFYLANNRIDDAYLILHDAALAFPDDALFPTLRGSLHLEEAEYASDPATALASYKEATVWLEKAVALSPDDPALHRQRAVALERTGHPESALTAVQFAREIDRQDLFSARKLLDLLVQLDRLDDATDACIDLEVDTGVHATIWLQVLLSKLAPSEHTTRIDRFHDQYGETAITLYTQMALHHDASRYDDALRAAKRFKELALSESPALLDAFFYYHYAALHERTGDLDSAEALFERTIAMADKEGDNQLVASAKNYIAYMWAERGEKLDQGLRLITRALEIDPENGAFIDTLGWILYMRGRYEEALEQLMRALERTGDHAEVLEHVGDTWIKLGDPEKAAEYWRRGLELEPDSPSLLERMGATPEPGLPPDP